jgi:hypothetical protein
VAKLETVRPLECKVVCVGASTIVKSRPMVCVVSYRVVVAICVMNSSHESFQLAA